MGDEMKAITIFKIVLAISAGLILFKQAGNVASNNSATVQIVAEKIDKSPKVQGAREHLIDALLSGGVVQKINQGVAGSIDVYVRPSFYSIDFDKKVVYMNAVYGFYFEDKSDTHTVALYDALTGKKIGTYSLTWGLSI